MRGCSCRDGLLVTELMRRCVEGVAGAADGSRASTACLLYWGRGRPYSIYCRRCKLGVILRHFINQDIYFVS